MFIEINSVKAQNSIEFYDDYELQRIFADNLFEFMDKNVNDFKVSHGILTKIAIEFFIFCMLDSAQDKRELVKKSILDVVNTSFKAFEDMKNGTA